MRTRISCALIAVCAGLLAPVSGRTADISDAERESLSLSELGMNFEFSYIWDSCGDRESGRTIRKVLDDELGKCLIDDGKKQSMLQNSARQQALAESAIDAYLAEHGRFPEKLPGPGFTRTCAEMLAMPEATEMRQSLQRYRAGEIASADVGLWRCHLKTGPSP